MKKREDEKILDVNAAMQGSLVFSDPVNLRINGKFEGTLTTKGSLAIGKSAQVKADILGERIIVSGNVKGNIKASEVIQLTLSAEVAGEMEAPRIAIEEGAVFNGTCRMQEAKISLEELSDYLSVEERKIVEWVNNGKIPVDRNGDKLLFDRKEVESWVAQNS